MPMLPSGRHVAINRAPLQKLLDEACDIANVHKVLAIRQKTDLYPFAEVLWLIPEDLATQAQRDSFFLDGSLPRPPGFVTLGSGYRLNQDDQFAADWSEEDKQAFWDFILVRADPLFEEALKLTLAAQERVRASLDRYIRLMVAWWDAGVHPEQTGAEAAQEQLPDWDTYDMLAAIWQMRAYMQSMDLEGRLLDDRMRETAIWGQYVHEMPHLGEEPDLSVPTRSAATMARKGKWLDALTADATAVLHRQLVYECVTLWDHLGPQLRQDFPGPGKIIELVVISPEAGDEFNQ